MTMMMSSFSPEMATSAAPWKQLLLNALQSNSHVKHSTYFQLATVGRNGLPANRTVVFRGFLEDTDKIQINTDSRTSKAEEIKQWPFAELCWYFTDTWEQFRVKGIVDVIDACNPDLLKLQQREKAWLASSIRSRQQYLGPAPGLPCLNEEPARDTSLNPSAGPVDSFCLLVLDPDQVDYLNLKNSERMSFSSTRDSSGEKIWNSNRINP